MMSQDQFSMLQNSGLSVTIHNVKVVGCSSGQLGHEMLSVEHEGVVHEVCSGFEWSQSGKARKEGKFGYLEEVRDESSGATVRRIAFRPYVDQTLRRMPALDVAERFAGNGRNMPSVGWICASSPCGFLAPSGVIPGESGMFIPDETVAVTLRVPREFLEFSRGAQMSPQALLRGFVADLCGVINYANRPRADGCCSNGSDERDMAEQWYERAYGIRMRSVPVTDHELAEKEEQAEERLSDFLEQHDESGGVAEGLGKAIETTTVAAVRRLLMENGLDPGSLQDSQGLLKGL